MLPRGGEALAGVAIGPELRDRVFEFAEEEGELVVAYAGSSVP
jgi:hypothetical protein